MKKFFYLMTAVIVALLFSACHEDEYLAQVTLPEDSNPQGEAVDADMLIEAHAHTFTLEVVTEGEWRIESDRRFLRPVNKEGNGSATVTISVQNNQSNERKIGRLKVIFPNHEDLNKIIVVEQKCKNDYNAIGAEIIDTSNKIYAVGYSYDCIGEYASPNSVKLEVLDTKSLIDDGILAVSAVEASLVSNSVTGSSVSEISNKLAVQASVKGGFGFFKAEASSAFNMSNFNNSSYEFASTYFDLDVRKASLSKGIETLKDDYMTDDAWNDINGVPVTNSRGIKKVAYPSTADGFKALVEQYGTHVVVNAGLGGRVRYSMEVDISKITSAYDIQAFAKASYSGIVSASASVDEKYQNSYEENKKNITFKLSVLGGDETLAKTLGTMDGFTNSNMNAWINSVTKDNMALVSFNENSLVPIYELVEKNATVDNGGFDGQARYEALKEYIENGCSGDFSSYDCGTVKEIDVPSFENSEESSNTLIKDIMLGGERVGQVCHEYIPIINHDDRVIVIYPVMGNNVCYNMGFFIGDNDHKPARVAWEGTEYHIETYERSSFGAAGKLYLRGSSVSDELTAGLDVRQATTQDAFLQGMRTDSKGRYPYKYPIVKIFNLIWTRTNYTDSPINFGSEEYQDYDHVGFYSTDDLAQSTFPDGWSVPSSDDYQQLRDKLVNSNWTLPGQAMLPFGALYVGYQSQSTGYDAGIWDDVKWWEYKYEGTSIENLYPYSVSDQKTQYWCSNTPAHVYITGEGNFDIVNSSPAHVSRFPIRLVKN